MRVPRTSRISVDRALCTILTRAGTGGGLDAGRRFDLFGGASVGRSADADVRIEDRYASQIHLRVYSRGGSYYVEDMNSTNGTFLNGSQLDGSAELQHLDRIQIGDTEFRFELEDA